MEKLKFTCDCLNYGGTGISGTLIVTDDTVTFQVSKLMKILYFWIKLENFTINIRDIKGCEDKALWYLDVITEDQIYHLNTFQKHDIISTLKSKHQAIFSSEGKEAPTFIEIQSI